MKIVFANQKGGCGKSTLLILLAAFLKKKLNKSVYVYDTDRQRTVRSYYEKENDDTGGYPLYEVEYVSVEEAEIINNLSNDDIIYLIDTPNQLDQNVFNVIKSADKVIVPFNYGKGSMLSTLTFLDVYKVLCEDRINDIFFIACTIKGNVKTERLQEFKDKIRIAFSPENVLENNIKDTVNAQRIDNLSISDTLISEFEPALIELTQKLNII